MGIQVSAGISVPHAGSIELNIDLISTTFEKGQQTFESGIKIEGNLGSANASIFTGAIGFEKSVDASKKNLLDLLYTDYEMITEAKPNTDLTVKIPLDFLGSIEFNITEIGDFISKLFDSTGDDQ
jgi:hypothetical protein